MKVIPLLFALLTAPTWCERSYSVAYVLAELNSYEGMHDVLERMEAVAKNYCTERLLVSSNPMLHLCRHDVVTELANKVDHAQFRDFVRQSQIDRGTYKRPILM